MIGRDGSPGEVEEVDVPRVEERLRNVADVFHEIHLKKNRIKNVIVLRRHETFTRSSRCASSPSGFPETSLCNTSVLVLRRHLKKSTSSLIAAASRCLKKKKRRGQKYFPSERTENGSQDKLQRRRP